MKRLTRCHVLFASLCTILLATACGGAAATRPARAPTQAVAPPAAVAPAEARPRPTAFVELHSVADRSPDGSRADRASRAEDMRALMTEHLAAAPSITLADDEAAALGIARFTVDATIERLERRRRGKHIEIACQLRIAVTDQRGKMLFFLTNSAAVRVPAAGFRREFVAPLQRDAIEGAAREIDEDLILRLATETRALSGPAIAAVE